MKKMSFVLFLGVLSALKSFAQPPAGDPDINILMTPASLVLNHTGTLNISTCNNGNRNIVANSLRITVSMGINGSITGVAPGTDSRWTVLSSTTGTNNTYVLINSGGTMTQIAGANPCASINLTVLATVVNNSQASTITGTIGYIAGPNCLLAGCAPSSSQGNSSTANDNSTTSLIVTPGTIVPILLLDFNAVKQGNTVQLSWQTSSEVNSDHFEIQYSKDGATWQALGNVAAAGNSSITKTYGYNHGSPVNGANYYRLRQVDISGAFVYSSTRVVNFSTKAGIKIMPNPVVATLYVTSDVATTFQSVAVFTAEGKLLQQNIKVASGSSIDMNRYTPGVYMIKIVDAKGNTEVHRVVKERM